MDADDPAELRLEKLRTALSSAAGRRPRPGSPGDLPFLAAVFDIPLDRLSAPSEVQPDRLRRQALLAAAQLVHAHAVAEPTMIFVDDVQWADQSSLDLLAVLLTMPALKITIAARDGFEPPWPETLVRRIVLDPLDEIATAELVRQTPSAAPLSPERSRELMQRSDGVPLFLEELLLTAQESETGRIPHRSLQFSAYQIPPALRDPLLARLSRPGGGPGAGPAGRRDRPGGRPRPAAARGRGGRGGVRAPPAHPAGRRADGARRALSSGSGTS